MNIVLLRGELKKKFAIWKLGDRETGHLYI